MFKDDPIPSVSTSLHEGVTFLRLKFPKSKFFFPNIRANFLSLEIWFAGSRIGRVKIRSSKPAEDKQQMNLIMSLRCSKNGVFTIGLCKCCIYLLTVNPWCSFLVDCDCMVVSSLSDWKVGIWSIVFTHQNILNALAFGVWTINNYSPQFEKNIFWSSIERFVWSYDFPWSPFCKYNALKITLSIDRFWLESCLCLLSTEPWGSCLTQRGREQRKEDKHCLDEK